MKKKETLDGFLSEYETIHKENPAYANTFAGMLEIARGLNELEEPYLIIGGLAVASYLHQMDSKAFENWRGTDDIDLVVPNKKIAEKVLRYADYEFRQAQNGLPGVGGRLYDYAKEDNGETTVVGFREKVIDKTKKDVTRKLLNHRAQIPVHGIRVSVPQLKELAEMKKWANREKDRADRKTLKRMVSKI